MYDIDFTPRALEELRWFKKHEQKVILEGIQEQLRYEPTVHTRNRKPLRPNSTATWELRIEEFRIVYDVDQQVRIVEIQRVGEKRGNAFFFRGRQEDL
jgi:mRNA-degrading endonuclease RelE of RelBE toxin-antitoxin system